MASLSLFGLRSPRRAAQTHRNKADGDLHRSHSAVASTVRARSSSSSTQRNTIFGANFFKFFFLFFFSLAAAGALGESIGADSSFESASGENDASGDRRRDDDDSHSSTGAALYSDDERELTSGLRRRRRIRRRPTSASFLLDSDGLHRARSDSFARSKRPLRGSAENRTTARPPALVVVESSDGASSNILPSMSHQTTYSLNVGFFVFLMNDCIVLMMKVTKPRWVLVVIPIALVVDIGVARPTTSQKKAKNNLRIDDVQKQPPMHL